MAGRNLLFASKTIRSTAYSRLVHYYIAS